MVLDCLNMLDENLLTKISLFFRIEDFVEGSFGEVSDLAAFGIEQGDLGAHLSGDELEFPASHHLCGVEESLNEGFHLRVIQVLQLIVQRDGAFL